MRKMDTLKGLSARVSIAEDKVDSLRDDNLAVVQMFERILSSTQTTSAQVMRLEERLGAHMSATGLRFDELSRRDREICALRHGEVDVRLAKIKELEDVIQAGAVSRLEDRLEEKEAQIRTAGARGFEWKKYAVSVAVGLVMVIVSSVISYHVSRAAGKPASSLATTAQSVVIR
jgi:hypothetical protein